MHFLGLDLGSSFLKAARLDPLARTITDVRRTPAPEPVEGAGPRRFEIDGDAVVAAVERLLEGYADSIGDCAGVLVCGQMGGLVLCGPDGEPRSRYLSWRDQRTTLPLDGAARPFFETLRDRLPASSWTELGNELRPGSASALLAWLVAAGRPPAADERPCGLADFVVARLGRVAARMEPTEAIGLLDLTAPRRSQPLDWHRAALRELIGVDVAWPELAVRRDPVAVWTVAGRRLPVYPPWGDHQAALAGSGLAAGELSINISTGSQVGRLDRVVATGAAQTRAYFDGWLLQTVTHLPAGRSLETLVDLLTELSRRTGGAAFDPWPAIVEAADEAPDTDLEVDLSFFSGPLGDVGAVRRITVDNLTVGTLFRAAWRSMADNYDRCARRLSPDQDWNRLVFSGGLAQKLDLLRRFIQDRFNRPARLCRATEDTLQGLLAAAMTLVGAADGVAAAGRLLEGPHDDRPAG